MRYARWTMRRAVAEGKMWGGKLAAWWRYPLHKASQYMTFVELPAWLYGISIGRFGIAFIVREKRRKR